MYPSVYESVNGSRWKIIVLKNLPVIVIVIIIIIMAFALFFTVYSHWYRKIVKN